MLTYHPLTLRRRTTIADDAVCLDFEPPPQLATAYRFEAGQHLAVRVALGGRELRRTYSIVSPAGGTLRIGVRVQGEVSRYLAEGLQIGETLAALPPTGRFKPTIDSQRSKFYMALAAGSGITPILSIVATVLAAEPASRVILVCGNRTIGRMMFLDEVLALKNRYLDRLTVHCLMSREPQEVAILNGRLDGARLRELAATEFDPQRVDDYFICGPGAMIRDLVATLTELGVGGKMHFERFGVEGGATRPAAADEPAGADARPGATEASVTMDGRRRSFRVGSGRTLLESAEEAGLELPYSCRAGVCSTCRAKLVSGTVTMDRNQALEEWEVRAGFVLCCQARATSARVELSYDEK
jgi:ring-1,2-phenylacetyl-CoA epoxidase subunit PaaE